MQITQCTIVNLAVWRVYAT